MKLDEKQKIWVDGICQLNFLYKENQIPQIRQEIEKQTSQMELAKEQYLNTLDTICLHVLNGDISKDIFHKHCKKILEVISESCEQDLKSYTNITKLLATLT